MDRMNHSSDLSLNEQVKKTGFSCLFCGNCCSETEPGSNLVLVSPEEVRSIMELSGLTFEEIAEPYPEIIHEFGCEYTFGWVIRRVGDNCMFHSDGRCMVYASRPWICRTYPFMLSEDGLEIHPCPGIGSCKSCVTSLEIAFDLVKRRDYEKEDENRILKIMQSEIVPKGQPVVIDGEGIKEYYG